MLKLCQLMLIEAQLIAASWAPVEWIKDQHHALPTKIGQADKLPVGIRQTEIGSLRTNRQAFVLCFTLHRRCLLIKVGDIFDCYARRSLSPFTGSLNGSSPQILLEHRMQ